MLWGVSIIIYITWVRAIYLLASKICRYIYKMHHNLRIFFFLKQKIYFFIILVLQMIQIWLFLPDSACLSMALEFLQMFPHTVKVRVYYCIFKYMVSYWIVVYSIVIFIWTVQPVLPYKTTSSVTEPTHLWKLCFSICIVRWSSSCGGNFYIVFGENGSYIPINKA